MTISVGAATNMGWSMGLPPWDVPSFSFAFGSRASLGIPLASLLLLSLDPKWIQLDSLLPLSLDPGPPLGFHSLLFFF